MNFVEELEWRGMIHDIMPGTQEQLQKEMTTAYVGIDPTADSLHIGHLVSVMMLKHLQVAGHRPIVLVGGATGMIGDPSGKSAERNLLDEKTLRHNQECLKAQLSRFLDFSEENDFYEIKNIDLIESHIPKGDRSEYGYVKRNIQTSNPDTKSKLIKKLRSIFNKYNVPEDIATNILIYKSDSNRALMVNNYDWMKEFSFLEFIRDIGKHLTVNYMMAKDSVKKRISGEGNSGLSFTEFTYQLVQGTDFYHLYQAHNCKLQMGGSDQWGNITTGTELIRRKLGGEAFAMTCPLITKADGGKFGKTESGNIWLDPKRTSPYKFYQFWLNTSDADAEKYIKIFTLLSQDEVETIVKEHAEAPHARALQKRLAEEVTVMIHGREAYETSVEASQILFGKSTMDALKKIDEDTFLSVFEGVPTYNISKDELNGGIDVLELMAVKTQIFPSKGEARKTIKGGGTSLNKEKISSSEVSINSESLLNDKYLLFQKGKKNYFVVVAE